MSDELRALLDEKAIVDLTVSYCWALDTRRFEDLRAVFLPDATANYAGQELDGVEAIMARCSEALTPLDDSQHIVADHQVRIDGDRATSRCYFHAQHIRRVADGGANFIVAGRYEDELERGVDGWRIRRRRLVTQWTEGNTKVVRPNA